MSGLCCSNFAAATGNPGGVIPGVVKKIILVNTTDSDSEFNEIEASDLVDGKLPDAYIEGRINNLDATKRWYPSVEIFEPEPVRADPNTDTKSGIDFVASKGTRTLTGQFINVQPKYDKGLNPIYCGDFGYYFIDNCGKVWGDCFTKDNGDQVLRPRQIQSRTWNTNYVQATETTLAYMMFSFAENRNVRDENMQALQGTYSLSQFNGLVGSKAVISGITNTGFTATVTVATGGEFGDGLPATGMDLADFQIIDKTTGTPIVPSTVTEGADGVYTVITPAQTATNTIGVSGAGGGFSFPETTYTAV